MLNSKGTFYNGASLIPPYRAVMIHGTGVDNSAVLATTKTGQIVGVANGSLQDPLASTAYHATTGKQIRLQDSEVFEIELGGTVDAGDLLMANSNGTAILATTTNAGTTPKNVVFGRALEDGAITKVIRAVRVHFYR